MAAVRALPKDVVIVSNDSYEIWVWADRPAYDAIENMQASFFNHDTPYGSDLSDPAQKAFRTQGAALVIFRDEFSNQLESAYGNASQARLTTLFKGLVLAGKFTDGAIYYYPK